MRKVVLFLFLSLLSVVWSLPIDSDENLDISDNVDEGSLHIIISNDGQVRIRDPAAYQAWKQSIRDRIRNKGRTTTKAPPTPSTVLWTIPSFASLPSIATTTTLVTTTTAAPTTTAASTTTAAPTTTAPPTTTSPPTTTLAPTTTLMNG